jgi:L-aspartate oxidase
MKTKVQQLMWEYAGILRTKSGLYFCLQQLILIEKSLETEDNVFNKDLFELRNLIITSKLIVSSALNRNESKGGHYLLEEKGKGFRSVNEIFRGS